MSTVDSGFVCVCFNSLMYFNSKLKNMYLHVGQLRKVE